jgi:hypothetical protein
MSRRERRRTMLVLTVSMVALAACSRMPPGGLAAGNGTAGLTGAPGTGIGGPAGTGGTAVPGAPGAGAGSGGAGNLGGLSAGGASGGGSFGSGGATNLSGPGITGHTIHVVFHAKLNDCGPDPQSSKQGTLKAESIKVFTDYVNWFNKYVFGPKGWKLAYQLLDDGGQFCPEVARATALKIVKQIKPFAVLGDSTNGTSGPVLADIVTNAHYLHIGLSWQTFDEYKKRNPYAWPVYGLTQQLDQYLAEWMGKRIKGTTTPDLTTSQPTSRNYGLITIDAPENHKLAGLLKAELAHVGISLTHEYYVASDPGVAAQTADNTVLKMKQDNVNTLIFAIPYTSLDSLLVHLSAMDSENYLPYLVGDGYGVVFFDELFDSRVWVNFHGISSGGPALLRASGTNPAFQNINENALAYKEAWTRQGNTDDADNPGNAYDVWWQLAELAMGVMNAGPVLTPQTFASGMDLTASGQPASCGVWRFLGRPYRYSTTLSLNQQHAGALYGYTTTYWVKKKNDFGTVGYYESYDGYRIFQAGELPTQPTNDTGSQSSVVIPKQKRIGLQPELSCTKFGFKD